MSVCECGAVRGKPTRELCASCLEFEQHDRAHPIVMKYVDGAVPVGCLGDQCHPACVAIESQIKAGRLPAKGKR